MVTIALVLNFCVSCGDILTPHRTLGTACVAGPPPRPAAPRPPFLHALGWLPPPRFPRLFSPLAGASRRRFAAHPLRLVVWRSSRRDRPGRDRPRRSFVALINSTFAAFNRIREWTKCVPS